MTREKKKVHKRGGGKYKIGMRNADDQASLLERTTYLVGLIESMIHCHDAKVMEVWEVLRKAVKNRRR